ncbi:MAG: DUF3160 domain-containing protein [Heliobacteriaceae bacterium]|nr:DUF3160 domain-containing protein [Heliobacteriaceae bacterium]
MKPEGTEQPSRNDPGKLTGTAVASEFADFPDYAVDVHPAVKPYSVAQDLSNVENSHRFKFSPAAQELLVKNGFVVVPSWGEEFYMMYEPNRYDGIPNFITTDAMLHNYHLFFNNLLERVEKEYMISELQKLNTLMLNEAQQQYEKLQGGAWENAARRNLAFFTVGSLLMNQNVAVPATVKKEVEQEMALIREHQAMALSPVMSIGQTDVNFLEGLKEDYTQYIPRGHYTRSEALTNYFKTMMWYGRMTFRLKSEDETRSAILLTLALASNDKSQQSWQKIYEPTCFFVGKSDDLGYYQYKKLFDQVYGNNFKPDDLISDQAKWNQFITAAQNLEAPKINSIPIFDETLQPDREKEIKGFRLLGQRYTLDADVFQRLIYREVKENPAGERRMLPRGLDIPAAMGSKEAYAILEELGDTRYRNYPENMRKMQSYIAGLDKNLWTQNLYWSWLHTLKPLTEEKPEGYPSFMCNQAWDRKELNTYLGSWTELKHDTILYAKQVMAEMGGGGSEEDDRGYVEPNPDLYARLAALSALTREGLLSRELLEKRDQVALERLEALALSLRDISAKELTNQPLSDEEYDLIRSFGGQLEHFWLEALRDYKTDLPPKFWDNPAALVADVATAPPDLVLEEATGMVSNIYVVVPVDGKLRIAQGGVYSYYEFPWPASDRLTDQKWKEMLRNQEAPELPQWTGMFTSK